LRKVNDNCIESIGIEPDPDLLSLAIISYVLSKILSKPRYFERKSNRQYLSGLKDVLLKCRAYSRSGREIETHECIVGMLKAVRVIAHEHDISCQVSLEERMACGVGVCLGCPVKFKSGGYKMVCKDGPVFSAEEIAW